MKKLLLAGLLAATTMGANATVITFDDSSFNTSTTIANGVAFDSIDLAIGGGSIIQTGSTFTETGSLNIGTFDIGGVPVFPTGYPSFKGYTVSMDYVLNGTAGFVGADHIGVNFAGGSAALFANGTTLLGNLSFGHGSCDAYTNRDGSCSLTMGFTPVAGYFALNGVDLLKHIQKGAGAWLNFAMTVQAISGYNTVGTAFSVTHDGNATINVPEPTTVAILGLGLLGFAGARRRKS